MVHFFQWLPQKAVGIATFRHIEAIAESGFSFLFVNILSDIKQGAVFNTNKFGQY